MQLLQHFDKVNTANHIIYRLKVPEWNQFVGKLADDFRLCYISNKTLNDRADKAGITATKFLEKYVIPDDPIIKSGDFGELLCYFIVKEHFENKGILLIAPRKWRWKDNRNKPAPGVDAIMFHIANKSKFTNKDLLVTIESKMKAVNSSRHRIQDAIDGARIDKLSRLAKTLSWLEEKYAKLGKEKARALTERFKDPATHGKYQKVHKGIAILDCTLEAAETAKAVNNTQGITVIVLSIKELQKAYEDSRMNIITSV